MNLHEIEISEIPQWLYTSEIFINHVKEKNVTIFYQKYKNRYDIPETDKVNNVDEFYIMIYYCDYFQYKNQEIIYPFSALVYYFLNKRNICHCIDVEKYRNSTAEYAKLTSNFYLTYIPILEKIDYEIEEHKLKIYKNDIAKYLFINDNSSDNFKLLVLGIYFLYENFEAIVNNLKDEYFKDFIHSRELYNMMRFLIPEKALKLKTTLNFIWLSLSHYNDSPELYYTLHLCVNFFGKNIKYKNTSILYIPNFSDFIKSYNDKIRLKAILNKNGYVELLNNRKTIEQYYISTTSIDDYVRLYIRIFFKFFYDFYDEFVSKNI